MFVECDFYNCFNLTSTIQPPKDKGDVTGVIQDTLQDGNLVK